MEARHERVTITRPASVNSRSTQRDATRRAADFTQHSPFKSPSGGGGDDGGGGGGGGGLNHDARRRVSAASPLSDTLRCDNISTHSYPAPPFSSRSLVRSLLLLLMLLLLLQASSFLLPPSSPDATLRDGQQRLGIPDDIRRDQFTRPGCLGARFHQRAYCMSYNSV